jgi:hypothetical protein
MVSRANSSSTLIEPSQLYLNNSFIVASVVGRARNLCCQLKLYATIGNPAARSHATGLPSLLL